MKQKNANAAVLKAAQDYAAKGWAVFPLHTIVNGRCTCGKDCGKDAAKHPRTQNGLKDASTDPDQIQKWFGDGSQPSNIAIVTGAVSGITVLDIDIHKGGDETWQALIADHGEPLTLTVETGSGGAHFYFRYNSALKTSANTLGKGVDVRNDAGYVVAPPSVHKSGNKYKFIDENAPLADLPTYLCQRRETRGRPRKDDPRRNKYSIEDVAGVLEVIPADDRDYWRHFGIILGREFNRSDEAWKLYNDWAGKWGGKKGRNHDEIMRAAFYELSQEGAEKELSIGTIISAAIAKGWVPKTGEVPKENFVYYMPGNNFIYRPTIEHCIAAAVDAAVSPVNENGKMIKASDWLKVNFLATSLTSDPSIEGDYQKGFDCRGGEIIESAGAALFNKYRPATIELGDAKLAKPFVDHVGLVFNKTGDASQFLDFMAHRVQRPWEKPRFALLIAGEPGVGKDTAISFCCPAIGSWNVAEIEPANLESPYNNHVASTLIRISEAANLADFNRWAFNEKIKTLIAGNPDAVSVNLKYGAKYTVRMYCGVVITTNHLANGIYIPQGDRRFDVIDSASLGEMGWKNIEDEKRATYFTELWEWFCEGGDSHVAAFLHERDISRFSPNNGQRITEAHKNVVTVGFEPDMWLLDALDLMENPDYVRVDCLMDACERMGNDKNKIRSKIAPTIARHGYILTRHHVRVDGRWPFGNNVNTIVYKKNGAGEPNMDELVNQPKF